jgi:hypothetical protein
VSLFGAVGPFEGKGVKDYGDVSKLRPHQYRGIPPNDPVKGLILDE